MNQLDGLKAEIIWRTHLRIVYKTKKEKMNGWEKKFCKSVFDNFSGRVLSRKQLDKVVQIVDKYSDGLKIDYFAEPEIKSDKGTTIKAIWPRHVSEEQEFED